MTYKQKYTITVTKEDYKTIKSNLEEVRSMAGVVIGMESEERIVNIWESEEKRLGRGLEKLVFTWGFKPETKRRKEKSDG
jgi:hypothetical protein